MLHNTRPGTVFRLLNGQQLQLTRFTGSDSAHFARRRRRSRLGGPRLHRRHLRLSSASRRSADVQLPRYRLLHLWQSHTEMFEYFLYLVSFFIGVARI